MENGFPVLARSVLSCKASRRLKPTIVGHFLLTYIYPVFARSWTVCLSLMRKTVVSYCIEIS